MIMSYRTIKSPKISGTITIDEVEQMVLCLEHRKKGINKHAITLYKPCALAHYKRSNYSAIDKLLPSDKKKTIHPIKRKHSIDVTN